MLNVHIIAGLDDAQKNQEYMQPDSIESNQASTKNDAIEARYGIEVMK